MRQWQFSYRLGNPCDYFVVTWRSALSCDFRTNLIENVAIRNFGVAY